MKYLLIMHMNPAVWETLTEAQQQAVGDGHGAFMDTIRATGEMISTTALAGASEASVVRVRNGVKVVTDGPYVESKEFLGGYYLIEVESRERAYELAAMIPDAGIDGLGIQVSEVVFHGGSEG